jgi:hypothetical protein
MINTTKAHTSSMRPRLRQHVDRTRCVRFGLGVGDLSAAVEPLREALNVSCANRDSDLMIDLRSTADGFSCTRMNGVARGTSARILTRTTTFASACRRSENEFSTASSSASAHSE